MATSSATGPRGYLPDEDNQRQKLEKHTGRRRELLESWNAFARMAIGSVRMPKDVSIAQT
jgi:hypothetical protein